VPLLISRQPFEELGCNWVVKHRFVSREEGDLIVGMSHAEQIGYYSQPVRDLVSMIQDVVSILTLPKKSRSCVTLSPAVYFKSNAELQSKGYLDITNLKHTKTSTTLIEQ